MFRRVADMARIGLICCGAPSRRMPAMCGEPPVRRAHRHRHEEVRRARRLAVCLPVMDAGAACLHEAGQSPHIVEYERHYSQQEVDGVAAAGRSGSHLPVRPVGVFYPLSYTVELGHPAWSLSIRESGMVVANTWYPSATRASFSCSFDGFLAPAVKGRVDVPCSSRWAST